MSWGNTDTFKLSSSEVNKGKWNEISCEEERKEGGKEDGKEEGKEGRKGEKYIYSQRL